MARRELVKGPGDRTATEVFMLLLPATALLAAPQAVAQAPAGGVVIDRAVAVVGDRILTASDVRLEEALARRDPSPVTMLRARQRASGLEALIDAAVIRKLAGDIAIYAPATTEVQQRLAQLRSTWADPKGYSAFLDLHGLDEERLAGRLYSRMVVERYVYRNTSLASESASETEEQAVARYLAWITDLRAGVPVRIIGPQGQP